MWDRVTRWDPDFRGRGLGRRKPGPDRSREWRGRCRAGPDLGGARPRPSRRPSGSTGSSGCCYRRYRHRDAPNPPAKATACVRHRPPHAPRRAPRRPSYPSPAGAPSTGAPAPQEHSHRRAATGPTGAPPRVRPHRCMAGEPDQNESSGPTKIGVHRGKGPPL